MTISRLLDKRSLKYEVKLSLAYWAPFKHTKASTSKPGRTISLYWNEIKIRKITMNDLRTQIKETYVKNSVLKNGVYSIF